MIRIEIHKCTLATFLNGKHGSLIKGRTSGIKKKKKSAMTCSVFGSSFTSKLMGERPNHDRMFKVCSIKQESRVAKLFHKSTERLKKKV